MEKKGSRPARERRRHPRKTCFFAEVDYAAHEGVYTDPIKDISRSGVFIETEQDLKIGDDVTMLFSDFSRIDLIRITGGVVRTVQAGVAVEFEVNDDMKKMSMEKYIDMV
jgi:Tfp pilus assembly protein PilZ